MVGVDNLSAQAAAGVFEEFGQKIYNWRQETKEVGGHIGGVYLVGILENTTDEVLDTVYVYFNLYDADDVRIDRCWAKLEKVRPGEKCEFKASYSTEIISRVKRTELAGVEVIDEKDDRP